MYKRVVLKLSGEALAGDVVDKIVEKLDSNCAECLKASKEALRKDFSKIHYDNEIITRLCSEIKQVKEKGVEISLIIGGGNFMRGRSAGSEIDRTKADNMGMLATVMNAIYFSESLRIAGLSSVVMTPFIVGTMTEQFSKDRAVKYLSEGKVLIFAGGSGHPFFSTDMITAIRAAELSADAILFAKNGVDGIYDSDPQKNKSAVKFDRLTYADFIRFNLTAIDISAVDICRQQNIHSIAFNMDKPGSIVRACTGAEEELYAIGTILSND